MAPKKKNLKQINENNEAVVGKTKIVPRGE